MCRKRRDYLCALVSSLVIALGASTCYAATPVPAAPGAPLPSSFPGPFWEVMTPLGGSASVSNAHLFLSVPGGSNHDSLLPSNESVRVVQPIGDQKFDVSIKIDSPVMATDAGTSQGLMVVADDKDFMTFGLATDGTHLSLIARTVTGGIAATVLNETEFSDYRNPMYLRLTRAGSAYRAFYSVDGVSWTPAIDFNNYKTPTLVGPFASNYNVTPTRAVPVLMSVNWFDVQ
jgi:hypothetical protein